jgi:predicted phage terminase large subunit-like protein
VWEFNEANGIGPTGVRLEYVRDPHRIKIAVAGRRSGKTLLAKRILRRWMMQPCAPKRFLFTGPTQAQTERIGVLDMIEFLKPITKSIRASPIPIIRTLTGHELLFAGVDESSRIEGVAIDGIICDEFHEYKPDVFDSTIAPMLVDRQAKMIVLGIPRYGAPNIEVLKRLWSEGIVPNDRIKSYTWHSSDVVPAAELESLRGTMMSYQFRTEFEASWEQPPVGGLIHAEWWKNKIVTRQVWELMDKKELSFKRGWDTAGGETKGADYTAGVLTAKHKDGRRFVVDVARGKWSPNTRDVMMKSVLKSDNDKYGPTPQYAWKSRTNDMNRSVLASMDYAIALIPEKGSKLDRAKAFFAPAVEAGNYYLVEGEWNAEFIMECACFTGEDSTEIRKDDQVDGVVLSDKMQTQTK